MKKLALHFRGIDSWNRPVFVDDNGRYFGATDFLFPYNATKETVLSFFKEKYHPLQSYIVFFGWKFGCEPQGDHIKSDIQIILD